MSWSCGVASGRHADPGLDLGSEVTMFWSCAEVLVLVILAMGCGGEGLRRIDARVDAGGAVVDGGTGMDGGGAVDAAPCDPPAPAVWDPADTMAPPGEALPECIARIAGRTDARIPDGQAYVLTTFGGPGDEQPVACAAPDADGSWYYGADAQRFDCGQRIRLVDASRTHCVVVEVADIGPHVCVEEAAGAPIWDVSPLAARALFGVDSAGWSEGRVVYGAPVASDNPLGPCDHLEHPSARLRGGIGGPCDSPGDCGLGGACLGEAMGFPGGHCTRDCSRSCPDQAGPHAFTACHRFADGASRCVARCDFTLFATGCREGYGCHDSPAPAGGEARRVCLPVVCR